MRRLRTAWSFIGLTLLCLLLCEGAARLAWWGRDTCRTRPVAPCLIDDGRALEECRHASAPVWEPNVYWRNGEYHGQFVTTDSHGERPVVLEGQGVWTAWLYGGSVAWGWGSADDQTLAAYLALELPGLRVRSRAVPGHNDTQVLISLARHLQAEPAPDVVVVIDGVNDLVCAVESAVGETLHEDYRRAEYGSLSNPRGGAVWRWCWRSTALSRLAARYAPDPWNQKLKVWARTKAAIERLRAIRQQIRALGVPVVFAWQPTVFVGKELTPWEEREARRAERLQAAFLPAHLILIEEAIEGDLTYVFAGHHGEIYIDWAHIGPRGNEILAAALAPAVREALGGQ